MCKSKRIVLRLNNRQQSNLKQTRKRPMRYSPQREAVYQVVRATKCHPDANYVYENVRKTMPNISLGTVYRNLAELCQSGRLIKVSVEGSAERFDACVTPHVHFVCSCCGAVTDLDDDCITLTHNVQGADHYQITFYGECENCRNKN